MKTRLIVFSSKTCGFCAALKKSKVIDRFVAKHPEVHSIELLVGDEEGNQPEGSEYAVNMKLSDDYEVEALPTIVLEIQAPDGTPIELNRIEGNASLKDIEQMYDEAVMSDEQIAAAKQIKWAGL